MDITPATPRITIELVADQQTSKDAVRGLLHAILFHRLFGVVKPQTLEVLDVTLPAVKDADIEKLVEDKVAAMGRALERGASRRAQLVLTLAEKRSKKQWFYVAEEEIPWEEWIINVEIRQTTYESERLALHTALASKLTSALRTILTHTASERGRTAVPLISSAKGISPFPIHLIAKVGSEEVI